MNFNKKRLVDTFLELVRTDSESFHEKQMQELLTAKLSALGCSVYVDRAGKKYDTNAQGNIIASFKGTVKSKPFLLCAHMDTVSPGRGVKPVVKKDKITSDGTTILGADDKAGIAVILETLAVLKETGGKYPPVEVLITLTEESGMCGAKNLEYTKLKSREGLILDNEETEFLLVQGPAVNTVEVHIKGVAAHAGVCPEEGISAVEVAAKALSIMKLGRIDKETVANFGIVQGGRATNIVMDELYLKGEARSLSDAKLAKQTAHMKACFDKAAKLFAKTVKGKAIRPKITFTAVRRYPAVHISRTHPMVKRVIAAGKAAGIAIKPAACGGGCDANILSGYGFTVPNLGVGACNCHTLQEYLNLKDFFAACGLVLDVVSGYKN